MHTIRKTLFIISVLPLLLLAACTTTPVSPEDVVKNRAQERWDAVLARDWSSAYELYSPGYRSKATVVDYEIGMRLRKVIWTSATYYGQECEENVCKVTYNVGWRVNSPVPGVNVYNGSSYITDQWIRTDGQWWYFPSES